MIRALMEDSLVLLKPDCLEGRKCGEVLKRFEEAGFAVFGVKMMRLSEEILREHYAHLTELPFFPEIQGFMQSSPVVAIALARRERASPASAKWSARPTRPLPRKALFAATSARTK